MSTADPPLGALVEVIAGRGIVRFCGATSFAGGKWVGIELSEPKGKNDGSVQDTAYFSCKPNYGVFVRPSQVKIIAAEPELPQVNRLQSTIARSALGHSRTPSTGLARVSSFRSSSSSRASSPAKPHAGTLPAPSSPGPSRLAPVSPTKRTPTLGLQPRKSLVRRPSAESQAPASPVIPSSRRVESPVSDSQHSFPKLSVKQPSPLIPSAPPPSTHSLLQVTASSSYTPPAQSASIHSPTNGHAFELPLEDAKPYQPASPVVLTARPQDEQEIQELRAKIRVLEIKRADDARHVRELETRLSEAESFVALRPKLQAKLTQLQTDLTATRRELADSQQLAQLADTRMQDAQEQLEMAMLDKEVAEERAELAEAELDEVKERLAVADVELNVLKEGGGELPDHNESAKSSLAYIQLEKQNERLKEALMRLRDMSQETEQEQRRRIAELEKDVDTVDDLQAQYESALIKLSNAETQVEDLKIQLDDALGAEEMLVQLTERNLMLGEKIEEMRITIEDLEALKELNDELEENHIETEKAMQEDLDAKDAQMREQAQKITSLEEACMDLETTIAQFRELVLQLQTELDTLRAQTQTAQHESATAASQTAAMMSLNLKLQSSASKNQTRNIELEIRKLEARESRELLNIVQPYLPQLYVETDSDSTSCYLFFQRIAYKADLISTVIAQAHGLPESLNGPVSDILVGVCEMRGRIAGLSTLCKRFAAILRRCDVESFLNIGKIYPEIAPMEKRIDMHIDLLRRDEFREMECVSDIVKMQAQFDHLSETYFDGFTHDLGERELGHALSFEHDLDVFAASIGLTKTSIAAIIKDEDVTLDLGDMDPETELFEPLQKLLDQCKSAKVLAKKLTKRVEGLIQDSAALQTHLLVQFKALSNAVPELVNFGISVAQQVMPHLSDVRSAKSPFQLSTVLAMIKQMAVSTVAKDLKPGLFSWDAVSEVIAQLAEGCNQLLPLAMEAENVQKITGTAPWVTRIEEIKANTAINVEAERKLAQVQDEMSGLMRTLKAKEQNIQESTVKIELMERRMEAVKKQADAISDLEVELSKAKKQERAYEEAMEQLQADLDTLEQDNAKLKTMASAPERQVSGAQQSIEPENIPVEGNLETSYLVEQIDALRGTVRYLRTENSYLKGQDLLREIQTLPALPDVTSRAATPPLDPSGNSDSEDSDSDRPATPPTLRSLAAETKMLYRDVIKFSSSPRVVDLTALSAKRAGASAKGGHVWLPRKSTPAHQILERNLEAEQLSKRVQGLLDRASHFSGGI